MADSTINIFGSSGEAMVGADTINTILASMDSKLTSDDINIETLGDGTVDVTVKNDTYTINLNHTHEGMAKLEKVTEATLPQTLANDTIYVQVDNLTTPTEIEALHIFGLEFTGGGLPAGTPAITKPSGTSINLGENSGSGVSKAIEIKANSHITGDLTVGLAANSNLSFDTTNLPSGVTYNSGAGTLTIAQATAMQGVNITIVYSGSGAAEIDGGLVISGGGVTPKSVVVVVVQPLAFWDGADAPINGEWIDKQNSLSLVLAGTASKTQDGYQFNNLSSPINASAALSIPSTTTLNNLIDKEFICVVDCKIKFNNSGYKSYPISFGSFGDNQYSNVSYRCRISQDGHAYVLFKNGPSPSGVNTTYEGATGYNFTLEQYTDVTFKVGARLLQNGKQQLFYECGEAVLTETLDTPVTINFAGNNMHAGAFVLDFYELRNDRNTINAYFANYKNDIIFKSIKFYIHE